MRKFIIGMSFIIFIILAGCGNSDADETLVISGKPWTEQYILPQIIGQYLEEVTDFNIEYEEGLGEVSVLTPAIDNGDIDMYVEYTGTGLEAVLDEQMEEGESSESVYERVKEGYEEEFNVTWLESLGFENTYTLAYSPESGYDAESYKDLVEIANNEEMVFGAPHSFFERQGDGYDALIEAYGFEFADTVALDPNVMYEALHHGEVDLIPAFTTDGRIERYDLVTTEDDLGFFPRYDAAILVRMEVLDSFEGLEDTLNTLAGVISEEDMQEMNARVDLDGDRAEDVARDFLVEKGLIDG